MGRWMESGVVSVARRRASVSQGGQRPLIMLPRGCECYLLLDAHAFRNAMNVLIAGAHGPFTVLVIRPLMPGTTLRIADVVLDQLRAGSGDLAGFLEAAVGVALLATDREGAERYCERVRSAWRRAGCGDLLIDIAEYPREEQSAIDLVTTDWSALPWMPVEIEELDRPASQRRPDDGDEMRTGVADLQ